VLPLTTFNSSCRRFDIVLTKDDTCSLTLSLSTNANKFTSQILHNSRIYCLRCSSSQGKELSQPTPIDQFLPLAIEVFGYLHKHAYVFLHDYANAIWSLKGTKSPHLSTLVTLLRQKVSITLQRMQVSSILNRVITVGLTTS
jgi:hypothetical protein